MVQRVVVQRARDAGEQVERDVQRGDDEERRARCHAGEGDGHQREDEGRGPRSGSDQRGGSRRRRGARRGAEEGECHEHAVCAAGLLLAAEQRCELHGRDGLEGSEGRTRRRRSRPARDGSSGRRPRAGSRLRPSSERRGRSETRGARTAFGGSTMSRSTATRPTPCSAADTRYGTDSGIRRPSGWQASVDEARQQAADDGADRDAGGLDGPRPRDAVPHIGLRVRGPHRVDVPRLERPALQCPRDPGQGHHDPELHDVGGDRHAHEGGDRQDP